MKVVYVAGPLSDNRSPLWLRLLRSVFGLPSGEEKNILVAMRVATELRDRGFSVVLPHLGYYWERYYPAPHHTWIGMCLALIPRMDAVYRVPGLSRGAVAETSCWTPSAGRAPSWRQLDWSGAGPWGWR